MFLALCIACCSGGFVGVLDAQHRDGQGLVSRCATSSGARTTLTDQQDALRQIVDDLRSGRGPWRSGPAARHGAGREPGLPAALRRQGARRGKAGQGRPAPSASSPSRGPVERPPPAPRPAATPPAPPAVARRPPPPRPPRRRRPRHDADHAAPPTRPDGRAVTQRRTPPPRGRGPGTARRRRAPRADAPPAPTRRQPRHAATDHRQAGRAPGRRPGRRPAHQAPVRRRHPPAPPAGGGGPPAPAAGRAARPPHARRRSGRQPSPRMRSSPWRACSSSASSPPSSCGSRASTPTPSQEAQLKREAAQIIPAMRGQVLDRTAPSSPPASCARSSSPTSRRCAPTAPAGTTATRDRRRRRAAAAHSWPRCSTRPSGAGAAADRHEPLPHPQPRRHAARRGTRSPSSASPASTATAARPIRAHLPAGQTTAALVGYVLADGEPGGGVELMTDSALEGTPGKGVFQRAQTAPSSRRPTRSTSRPSTARTSP